MSDNFLSRWSRRKLEAKTQTQDPELSSSQPAPEAFNTSSVKVFDPPRVEEEKVEEIALPLPTEEDLDAVRAGGDVRAFLSEKVSKDLKNKAFKALFSRPEFNVMDGLDIYIDDYNKFTPLTKADIDKMTLSKQLLSRPDLEALKNKLDDVGVAISSPVPEEQSLPEQPEQAASAADVIPEEANLDANRLVEDAASQHEQGSISHANPAQKKTFEK